MRSDVGHVELSQDVFGRTCIVVSRATHERKPGKGNHGIDRGLTVFQKVSVYCWARVQARGKSAHHLQALYLEGGNHRVIVLGVVGNQVRA